ncbi:MAG TPA: hypothetical protein DD405_02260 [Desulfobacteraceae bacterium]|nr:hypothetical protein [Desulfobacteraceae bacterium]
MILHLLNVITPVLIVIALGWGWVRSGRPYDTNLVTGLVMTIGAPCLVFSTLSTLHISPQLLVKMGGAALGVMGLSAVIGAVILRFAGLSLQDFLPPLIFANIGNMGLPLCLFAFGKPGLALAIVVFTVFCIGHFTVGVWLYSGSASLLSLLKIPVIYAVGLAIVVLLTRATLPEWIVKTTELLGSFTIPLMLLTLGVSLGRLQVMNIRRAMAISLLRLGMGFGLGILAATLFNFTGTARGVIILQSSMPVAVFNYLLAQQYQRNANETAGLVVISTLCSLATLPLVLVFIGA